MADHYKNLDIKRGASEEEIEEAYLKKTRELSEELAVTMDAGRKKAIEEILSQLNESYRHLTAIISGFKDHLKETAGAGHTHKLKKPEAGTADGPKAERKVEIYGLRKIRVMPSLNLGRSVSYYGAFLAVALVALFLFIRHSTKDSAATKDDDGRQAAAVQVIPKFLEVSVRGEEAVYNFPVNTPSEQVVKMLKKECFQPVLSYKDDLLEARLIRTYFRSTEYGILQYFEVGFNITNPRKTSFRNPAAYKTLTDHLGRARSCQEPSPYNNYPGAGTIPDRGRLGNKGEAVFVGQVSDGAVPLMLWLKIDRHFFGSRHQMIFKIPDYLADRETGKDTALDGQAERFDGETDVELSGKESGKMTARLIKAVKGSQAR